MTSFFCRASMAGVILIAAATASFAGDIKFKRTQIEGKFRSEGSAIGDLNNDGKADVSAGSVYFAAPDWKMHVIADEAHEFDPANYSDTFCNFIDDINGDGWNDVIVVDFPGKQTWWFENPQSTDGKWKRHEAVPVTNNESPNMLDIDGDGRRELIFSDGENRLAYAKPTADAAAPWKITPISKPNAPGTQKFSHGLGVGDVNADGRQDVLCNEGWWEAPEKLGEGEWEFHAAPFGEHCANMYVYDFDGDGDNDVLSSSAHAFGIWWHEQTPEGWKTHEIDKSFSQTHALWLADINGDGLPDFVTGKRWWAHGASGDPGSDQPAVMYWFELTRENGKPKWIAHQFDHDSGVGTQFDVADINGDGLLDIGTSNKKGTNVFLQVRQEQEVNVNRTPAQIAELVEANNACRLALEAANDTMQKAFDRVKDSLHSSRVKVKFKVKQFEQLQAERVAFETKGELPKANELAKDVEKYKKAVSNAHKARDRVFEDTAEKYSRTDLAFANAILQEKLTPPPSAQPRDTRQHWEHADGYFKLQDDGSWKEASPNGRMYHYKENARTDDYVELIAISGDTRFRYRLYEDRCEFRTSPQMRFKPMFAEGKWIPKKYDGKK